MNELQDHRSSASEPPQPAERPSTTNIRASIITHTQSFVWPLPPPHVLGEYNTQIPGCGDKIVEAFLAEGEHRRNAERIENEHRQQLELKDQANETLLVHAAIQAQRRAFIGACVFGVGALIVAGILAWHGHTFPAAIAVSLPFGGAGATLYWFVRQASKTALKKEDT